MRGDAAGQVGEHGTGEPRSRAQEDVDALLVERVERDVLRRRPAGRISLGSPRVDRAVEPALRRDEPRSQRTGGARDGCICRGRAGRRCLVRLVAPGAAASEPAAAEAEREGEGEGDER